MSVAIADLFVNLGIKGSDKTVGALSEVKKGMGEVKSMSLEAKAAILGAIYALYSLTKTSSEAGTAFLNNSILTGNSIQNLQRYSYAARQVGASTEDMMASFEGLGNVLNNIDIGKGLPEGAKTIANTIGGLDINALRNLPKDQQQTTLLQYLQKFAQSDLPERRKLWALQSFGLNKNIIAGMERNAFNPQALSAAPVYSDAQTKNLDKSRKAWGNAFNDIEMSYGKLNAEYGVGLASTIEKLAQSISRLVEALIKLENNSGVLDKFGKVVDFLADKASPLDPNKAGDIKTMGGWRVPMVAPPMPEKESALSTMMRDSLHSLFGPPPSITINQQQNITHHGDAKDTNAVKEIHGTAGRESQKGVHKVVYGSPTQTEAN